MILLQLIGLVVVLTVFRTVGVGLTSTTMFVVVLATRTGYIDVEYLVTVGACVLSGNCECATFTTTATPWWGLRCRFVDPPSRPVRWWVRKLFGLRYHVAFVVELDQGVVWHTPVEAINWLTLASFELSVRLTHRNHTRHSAMG